MIDLKRHIYVLFMLYIGRCYISASNNCEYRVGFLQDNITIVQTLDEYNNRDTEIELMNYGGNKIGSRKFFIVVEDVENNDVYCNEKGFNAFSVCLMNLDLMRKYLLLLKLERHLY